VGDAWFFILFINHLSEVAVHGARPDLQKEKGEEEEEEEEEL
jgi:hypothetical protein